MKAKIALSLGSLASERGLLTPEQVAAALERAGGDETRVADAAIALGFVPEDRTQTFRQAFDKLHAELTVARQLRDRGLVSDDDIEAALKSGASARLTQTLSSGVDAAQPEIQRLPEEVERALGKPDDDLGRYVLVGCLGTGGVGSVWKAWQKDLRRYVAVKFLELGGEADAERFRREAQVLSQVEHPNIARVYDVGERRGKPYLVMQYIDGRTVDMLDLPPEAVARTLLTVARALDAAHRRGVVHRDVKPSNIMIDEQNQVFVMDFGLAKRLDVPARLTLTGSVMGTPAYMSPEQARGEEVDARTDVYSVGATAYDLLAHRPPQVGTNLVETLERIAHREPVSLRRLNPKVPADLETVVLKCLCKEKDRRYSTALELADDLRRFLEGEPVRAKRVTLFYRLRRKVSRHPWVTVATAAAVLIGIGFGAYVLGGIVTRRSQKIRWVEEGEADAGKGQREQALGVFERAHALEPWDETVRVRKDAVARRVHEDRERLQAEAEGARLQKEATETYRAAERDVYLVRVRSYRPDWRLTDEEFKRFERLIDTCLKQLAHSGPSADGWWVIGRARQVLGDWNSAIDAFDTGLKAQPDHSGCLLDKARVLMERAFVERRTPGRENLRYKRATAMIAEAVRLLDRAAKAGTPDEFELDLARGYELVIKDRATREYAARMLKKWEGHDFREEFLLLRGLGSGSWETLIEDATEAVRIRPGFYAAIFWRGVERTRTDLDAAIKDYNETLRLNPRFVEAYINRGIAREKKGDLKLELEDLRQAVEISPRYALAHYDLGFVYTMLGEHSAAVTSFTRAIELDPDSAEAYYNRGLSRSALGLAGAAVEDFSSAIRIFPRYVEAYRARALESLKHKDHASAIDDYTKALEFSPNSAGLFSERALANWGKRDFKAAIADCTKAVELDPHGVDAYFCRGCVHQDSGDLKRAIDDFGKAIECDPRRYDAYLKRAGARWILGEAAPAIEDYTRAIELNSKASAPYCGRAMIRMMTSDLQGAIDDFTRALQIDPDSSQALAGRAWAREVVGDLPASIDDYTRAIEKDSRVAEWFYGRSLALRKHGDLDASLKDADKAVEMNGDSPDFHLARAQTFEALAERDPAQRRARLEAAKADLERALDAANAVWASRAAAESERKTVCERLDRLDEKH